MNLGVAAEESSQAIHIPADINWEMLDKSKFFLSLCGLVFRSIRTAFWTSLMGTIPARALYITALEVTKSNVGSAAVSFGFTGARAAAIANVVGGLASAMAAQLVWTPVDVVSQRLMVQGSSSLVNASRCNYVNGFYAFRMIVYADGPKGLYIGFGISILTYAASNALWWASYSVAQRMVWSGVGCYVKR